MATKKRKTRELAMQLMFLWDSNAKDDLDLGRQLVNDHSDDEDIRRAALDMARGAWEGRQIADTWVERLAPQWPSHRQPPVDRNLLRLAVWELTAGVTPPKVVLDEAIELAKHFSTENSPMFINGVLDAVLKEHEALTGTGSLDGATEKSEVMDEGSAERNDEALPVNPKSEN